MAVAYWIESDRQRVVEINYKSADLRRLIGGSAQMAYGWANGDVLYVDVDGLNKSLEWWFRIPERPDQALAGNGVMLGREIGGTPETETPTMSLDQLRDRVLFLRAI